MIRGPWPGRATYPIRAPADGRRRTLATLLGRRGVGCARSGGRITPIRRRPLRGTRVSPRPAGGLDAEEGLASWYGEPYHGRPTASGPRYDMWAMTAAHRTLPFGTRRSRDNLDTTGAGRSHVNDRGPFVAGRVLDLSRAAAERLDAIGPGVIPVRLEIVRLGDGMPDEPCWEVQVGAFAQQRTPSAPGPTSRARGSRFASHRPAGA